jgi:hypothetical protein
MMYQYWSSLDCIDRRLWRGMVWIAALFLFHYFWFSTWVIEDAAISFSFARNAAAGEGFVAWPGGERVEGFSNPLWTLLLTAGSVIRFDPWVAAKLWGAVFGVLTLPLAAEWVRLLRPGKRDLVPLLAPFLLAISPQFVMWAASGLENCLLNFLIGLGSVLTLREIQHRTLPWSGFIWGLVAITRPEAPMYAFVAGCAGGASALALHGPMATLRWAIRWLAFLAPPFFVWHLWRFSYFAWELPNTYYAKLDGQSRFRPWKWQQQGWKYLRAYGFSSGQGFLFPLYIFGQIGFPRWRKWAGLVLVLFLLVLLLPGLEWLRAVPGWPIEKEASWWAEGRIICLGVCAFALPLLGMGRAGWAARWFAWGLTLSVVFFTLYSGWDWMKGYRWLSMCAVPMAVLLADGLGAVWDALPKRTPRLRWTAVGLPVGALFIVATVSTVFYLNRLETSPYDVRRRALYMQEVQRRLHLDHAALLEVDMGAHMWWSGFELVDMAGLVDVPMGHHKWEKPFIAEYVYQERNPEFAHVHGSWAEKTRMRSHKEWRRYLPIDPYPTSTRTHHTGSHIRKDLIVAPTWEGPSNREVNFSGGVTLLGWDAPAGIAVPGEGLYLEVGLKKTANSLDFRMMAFLSNGTTTLTKELPPGYDWYPPRKWRKNSEVVLGFHTLTLPDDFPPGSYDLGFFIYDAKTPRSVLRAPPGAQTHPPLVAHGEVHWAGEIQVLPWEQALTHAEQLFSDAKESVSSQHCIRGAALWKKARRVVTPTHPWSVSAAQEWGNLIAPCWSNKALVGGNPLETLRFIKKARQANHRHSQVIADGRAIADEYTARANKQESSGDLKGASLSLRVALAADPTRSWTRRRAERIRDTRLNLNGTESD